MGPGVQETTKRIARSFGATLQPNFSGWAPYRKHPGEINRHAQKYAHPQSRNRINPQVGKLVPLGNRPTSIPGMRMSPLRLPMEEIHAACQSLRMIELVGSDAESVVMSNATNPPNPTDRGSQKRPIDCGEVPILEKVGRYPVRSGATTSPILRKRMGSGWNHPPNPA